MPLRVEVVQFLKKQGRLLLPIMRSSAVSRLSATSVLDIYKLQRKGISINLDRVGYFLS